MIILTEHHNLDRRSACPRLQGHFTASTGQLRREHLRPRDTGRPSPKTRCAAFTQGSRGLLRNSVRQRCGHVEVPRQVFRHIRPITCDTIGLTHLSRLVFPVICYQFYSRLGGCMRCNGAGQWSRVEINLKNARSRVPL